MSDEKNENPEPLWFAPEVFQAEVARAERDERYALTHEFEHEDIEFEHYYEYEYIKGDYVAVIKTRERRVVRKWNS